ncbi:SRRD [Branchiostoma lanceolatum]|uniref:SRRD protein n=1 Tax=Branchiostoma lanceolatum TaxID=7740 RepID=A0A8K0EBW8_BRALA|nr:SRRD [Branchiostoma lanceolatum]
MVCPITKMAAPGSAADVADGFQLVTSKTRRKRRRNRHQQASANQAHTQQDGEDDSIDLTKLEKKILASKEELRCTEFFSTVKDIFRHVRRGDLDWEKMCVPSTQGSPNPSCGCEELKSTWDRDSAAVRQEVRDFDAIVCYGLGRFSSCVTARYQLGLLLLLMEVLHVPGSCYVYDPVFSSSEKLLLEKLGCQLILTNEEGKRPVDRRTLFYMPHCGKPLYNNLLWANWGQQLSKLIILGNSLSNMALRFPRQELKKSAFYIHSILDYTKEVPLPNNFHFLDVFNDLSLHVFPVTDISPPRSLWQRAAEPVYDLDWQEEIITSWNK